MATKIKYPRPSECEGGTSPTFVIFFFFFSAFTLLMAGDKKRDKQWGLLGFDPNTSDMSRRSTE